MVPAGAGDLRPSEWDEPDGIGSFGDRDHHPAPSQFVRSGGNRAVPMGRRLSRILAEDG
jgi:hypothetical protein